MTQRSTTVALAGRALALSILTAWLVFMPIAGKQDVGAPPLGLDAEAETGTVAAGQTATYAVTITNPTDATQTATLRHLLPEGFSYLPGSTQIRQNGALVSTQEPAAVGSVLTWEGLSVLRRRAGTHYGMHTFVQDRCDSGYINTQLEKVLQVAGPGAYVKQLLYRIDTGTHGPEDCWKYFVQRCYDLGLVPVVRLGTDLEGSNWRKPEPYAEMAQAFKHVVAGLPRSDGHTLYVEIGNEPNLNLEWGGAANGAEYGQFLVLAAAAIRELGDPRIVLLNGGLSPTGHMAVSGGLSPTDFIDQMATVPGALQAFDVWASHPYPGNRPPEQNLHDGSAADYTFLAIDSYLLELDRLAEKGRTGLKVLLTETGYRLNANDLLGPLGLPAINDANRADYIARAFRDYWSRWPEIIGVCPFLLLDPANPSPWAEWVWMDNESAPRQQYYAVQALDKTPSMAPGTLTVTFRATVAGWAGTYRSDASLSDGSGGTRTIGNVAAVQVTGAERPSGGLVCYEALQNGGFEEDGAWTFGSSAMAGYTSEGEYSGDRAGRIGLVAGAADGTNYSSARQAVMLPSNTVSATLSLWYCPESRDVTRGRQYVWLLNDQGARLANALWIASDAQTWQRLSFDLLGNGQTVIVHLGTYFTQGYDPIGMIVDDVSLWVCTAGEPAPTATATVMPTVVAPSPGAPVIPALHLPVVLRGGAAMSPSPSQGEGRGEGDVIAAILARDLAAAEASPEPRPTPTPRWLPADDGSVDALALDVPRGRILAVAGSRLLVRDLEGRVLEEVTLPDGAVAGAIALDEADGTVYLALPEAGQIVRHDATGAAVVAEGLGRPLGLAVSPRHLYVGDAAGKRLVMLDREGHGIMRVTDLGAAPGGLAYDALMHRIYVTQLGPGTLLAFDADTLEPLGEVTLGGLGLPRALALDAAARRLYVAHDLSPKYGAVSVVDTGTWRVIADCTGTWARPLAGCSAIAVDAERGHLMVSYSGGIAVLDPGTLEVVEGAPLPPGATSRGLALDPATGIAYLGGEGGLLWRADPRLHTMQALP
jgi:uncharacterized repeat protein (TIGR01451 family)